MSKTRDALVAVGMVVIMAGGYWYSARPSASYTAVLRGLYASPLCLRADGSPRPGSPTVARAWARTIGSPIEQAPASFVGLTTIEIGFGPSASRRYLSFIQAGAHRWRFNDDATTNAWVAHACGILPGPN
jgi:hypothetical protein